MSANPINPTAPEPLTSEDFYMDGDLLVFTAAYHLKRGYCCGSGCRHCPYAEWGATAAPQRPEVPAEDEGPGAG